MAVSMEQVGSATGIKTLCDECGVEVLPSNLFDDSKVISAERFLELNADLTNRHTK